MNNTSAANVGQTNDHSLSENAPSKAEGIVWCAFILISILTVAGNLLTIILFVASKSNRKKNFVLPVNMAFADLMLGAVPLPLYTYHVGFTFHLWTITESFESNKSLDIFFKIADTAFAQASLISAAFISCERFYAIYWPFKQRTLSKQTYCIVIFAVWILAFLTSAIWTVLTLVFNFKHATMFWGPYTLILILIMCGCNIGIWRKFQSGSVAASHQQNRDLQNKRLTKILLFVSGLTLLAWLPVMIMNFLMFVWLLPLHWKLYHMVQLFGYFNSLVNPVVYALRTPEFRQTLTLCCFGRNTAMNATLAEIRKTKNSAIDISHEITFEQQDVMDTTL